jgi:hypothetical protein
LNLYLFTSRFVLHFSILEFVLASSPAACCHLSNTRFPRPTIPCPRQKIPSLPLPQMSYNRVLPRPVPLYDASQARFPSWSNDLLKYKIVNDEGPTRLSPVNWPIDDDLCGYPARGPATGPPQVHFASKGPSRSIGRIDSDPPVASPRLNVPAFTRTLPMPTRNSQVGRCSSSRPVKSAASRELLAQSCLCRTGPKIPRPKNGRCLSTTKQGRC